jgi:hypothetical protein
MPEQPGKEQTRPVQPVREPVVIKKIETRIGMIRFVEGLVVLNALMIIPEWSERNISLAMGVVYGCMFAVFLTVAEIMVRRYKCRVAKYKQAHPELLDDGDARKPAR